MVKSKEAFSWKDGVLPVCGIHSQVKLDILRDYILAYFQTVAAKPFIPRIPISTFSFIILNHLFFFKF